jgi:hypothetical protein
MTLPRGKYIGLLVGEDVADEVENFFKCAECGCCWLDMRDLGAGLDHEGPLPPGGGSDALIIKARSRSRN